MKTLLLVLSIQFFSACAMTRADSSNELNTRADLDGSGAAINQLSGVHKPLLEPVRTNAITTDIWVHPHELSSGDYFRGAWIRTIVQQSRWTIQNNIEILRQKKRDQLAEEEKLKDMESFGPELGDEYHFDTDIPEEDFAESEAWDEDSIEQGLFQDEDHDGDLLAAGDMEE